MKTDMQSNKFSYMESPTFDECSSSSNPIDLSRRRDSVETRKTPSPYNSSNFGGSSPSIPNDSPSTNTISSSNSHSMPLACQRSATPTHHYQSNNCMPQYRPTAAAFYPYQPKRESPSPPENITNIRKMQEYSAAAAAAAAAAFAGPNPDEIQPYLLHAVALQQKFVQSQIIDRPPSSEMPTMNIPASITPTSITPQASSYPMVLGRDGKLSRPFKAYPRDPLTISASIGAADTLIDQSSAQKFNQFRKQMLEQIHAANGGHPTISNPKMRRTSSRSFVDNIPNDESGGECTMTNEEAQQNQQSEFGHHSDSSSSERAHSSSSGTKGSSIVKDNAYYERRKKNNAAAKKSRDRRRIKEDEIAIRAAYLERENIELKIELAATKRQLSKYVAT